jgi:hypothetical protein
MESVPTTQWLWCWEHKAGLVTVEKTKNSAPTTKQNLFLFLSVPSYIAWQHVIQILKQFQYILYSHLPVKTGIFSCLQSGICKLCHISPTPVDSLIYAIRIHVITTLFMNIFWLNLISEFFYKWAQNYVLQQQTLNLFLNTMPRKIQSSYVIQDIPYMPLQLSRKPCRFSWDKA